MRRFTGAGLLGVLLAAGVLIAQDGPIEIKIRKTAQGDVVRETKTENVSNKLTISVMGADQKKDENTVAKFVYVETVIEKAPGAKRGSKLKRAYETAEIIKDGEKQDLGLAGKTVLIEKKGEEYTYRFESGGAVDAKAAEILTKEFSKKESPGEEAFMPKKPVKVGETWAVDITEATKELTESGMTINPDKSKATGTLKKVYDRDGKRFGVIDVKLDLTVTKVGGMGQEIPLKEGSKLSLDVELDGCIDGTESTGTGVIRMKGNMAGEFMGVGLTILLDGTMTGRTEQMKK